MAHGHRQQKRQDLDTTKLYKVHGLSQYGTRNFHKQYNNRSFRRPANPELRKLYLKAHLHLSILGGDKVGPTLSHHVHGDLRMGSRDVGLFTGKIIISGVETGELEEQHLRRH